MLKVNEYIIEAGEDMLLTKSVLLTFLDSTFVRSVVFAGVLIKPLRALSPNFQPNKGVEADLFCLVMVPANPDFLSNIYSGI
jgi:hypothetical protein